jgi:hypothetical protein
VRRIDLFSPERTTKPNEKQMNKEEKRREMKRKEEQKKAKNETTFYPLSIMIVIVTNGTFAYHSSL